MHMILLLHAWFLMFESKGINNLSYAEKTYKFIECKAADDLSLS